MCGGGGFFTKSYKDIRTSMGSTRCVLHDGANGVFVMRINQRFSSGIILYFFQKKKAQPSKKKKNRVAKGNDAVLKKKRKFKNNVIKLQ